VHTSTRVCPDSRLVTVKQIKEGRRGSKGSKGDQRSEGSKEERGAKKRGDEQVREEREDIFTPCFAHLRNSETVF
jgi:hypothetical protein